jgi:hypothetical protein
LSQCPFWIQNIIFSIIVGCFSVVLLVIIALSIDGMDDESLINRASLELKIEKLQKEINELKKTNA